MGAGSMYSHPRLLSSVLLKRTNYSIPKLKKSEKTEIDRWAAAVILQRTLDSLNEEDEIDDGLEDVLQQHAPRRKPRRRRKNKSSDLVQFDLPDDFDDLFSKPGR